VNKSLNRPVIASMKTNLIGLAVAATALTSFAAFADDWDDDHGVQVSVGWSQPTAPVPCDTHLAVPAAPAPRADGRYELRETQKWIPARYEQVTVQQCREKRHGGWNHHNRRERCYPVTQTRLVPGYSQTVQEWVWVPTYPAQQQYSQYPGHRPPLYGQGRVGFRVGTR